MSDLFATAAKLNSDNGRKLAVQKKRDSGDLFKSAWDFGSGVEAKSKPKLSKDSVFSIGLLKYDPDQPRDDHGRWTDEGGGGSLGALNAAASRVRAGDSKSAEQFLQSARDFVADVERGDIQPTNSQWKDALSPAGKVLERLARSVEMIAVPAGVGVAVGTLVGASIGSRVIGFRVGAAVAGILGVALLYDSWMNNKQLYRSKEEARRLRESINELEYSFRQFKEQE